MIFKCKPTWNFQSIEFEVPVNPDREEEMDYAFDIYKACLLKLMEIAPRQDEPVPLATEKQKQIMKAHNIKFGPTTTNAEAQALITASIEKAKKIQKK